MLESRREVEEERVVLDRVEVEFCLNVAISIQKKGNARSPVKNTSTEACRVLAPALLRAPVCRHTTSVRCATRSIRYATTTSTGTRKSEIAAPAARSLPAIPVAKASDGSVCVESNGPPAVRM